MAMDEPGQDHRGVDDPRLSALDERLKGARDRETLKAGKGAPDSERGYSQGNKVLSALIGSLVGSALIGWLIDRWMGTEPWGLIVMLFLGIAVAFRQIMRISGERSD